MSKKTPTYSIELPFFALQAIELLEAEGYEAWCVGGYVRDALRGIQGCDIDLATSAHWQDVQRIFEAAGHHSYETGIKHGTITVSVESNTIEITTFRRESTYSDTRHPDAVEFVDTIEEDLARRDFTINAMAYNPTRGLRDPFGGIDDLEAQIIKAVGIPRARFSEDALRILRGCRFVSQLGFSLDAATADAMNETRALLEKIAVERVVHELDALFKGAHIHHALMECIDIIGAVIPEALPMKDFDQRTPYHIYDVLEHTACCMENCPSESLVRWSAFFHDIGKPASFFTDDDGVGHFYGHAKVSVEIAQKVLKRLKVSPRFTKKLTLIVKHHDDVIPAEPKPVKRALHNLDEDPDLFRTLCYLKVGDALAQAPHCHGRVQLANDLMSTLEMIIADNEAFSLKDLKIKGSDVLACGVEPGPEVGRLLTLALDAVIDGTIPNEHEALISFVASQANEDHD